MCGIAGLFRLPGTEVPDGTLEAMTEMVAHRGPDGWGIEYLSLEADTRWRAGLGHRRLSILDLSEAGHQPMCYRDRLWLSFNGEIYNYIELRKELEALGHHFRSHCDTEVILAAYDEWGNDCFRRFRGMWGIILVDLRRRIAILSRDRLGIKPVYITRRGGLLAVASEIKQFTALPGDVLRVNESAVRQYAATGFESSTTTFFHDVYPVPAGHFQVLDLDTLDLGPAQPFWFPDRVEMSIHDAHEAGLRFRLALQESLRLHMRSDVPVGCALSGGMDSSSLAVSIAALEDGAGPKGLLNTFSVTFPGQKVDERQYIDYVLRHIPASAHFVTPDPEVLLQDFDDLTWKHDEPVGSLSQYNGYCVARLTRQHGVPVTINGQGGDEILSGYWQCYFVHLRRMAQEMEFLRLTVQLGGALLPGGNPELWQQAPRMLKRYRDRKHMADNGAAGPLNTMSQMTAKQWRVFEIRYLTLPRLLKWDDRNFMAFGVEGRYPFLDHVMIEVCLSFAPHVLYDRGWTKMPMRHAMIDLLPRGILRRRNKVSFEPPQDRWLVGALMPLVDSMLEGPSPVWEFVDRHQGQELNKRVRESNAKSREDQEALMRLILLDRWLRRFKLA